MCTLRAAFSFCFTEVPWDTGPDTLLNITDWLDYVFCRKLEYIIRKLCDHDTEYLFCEKNVTVTIVGRRTSTAELHMEIFQEVDTLHETYPKALEDKNSSISGELECNFTI